MISIGGLGTQIKKPGMPPGYNQLYHGQFQDSVPDSTEQYSPDYSSQNFNLVAAITTVWQHENQIYQPIQLRADECCRLANMEYSSPILNPEKWEHQTRYPFMARDVQRYVATFSAMLDKSDSWLQLEATSPSDQVYYNLCKKLLMDLSNKKSSWGKTFRQAYKQMVRFGLCHGQCYVHIFYTSSGIDESIKLTKQQSTEDGGIISGDFIPNTDSSTAKTRPFVKNPNKNELVMKVFSPSDVRRDSSELNRYVMWKTTISRGQLRDHAESLGYDLEAVERVCVNQSFNVNPQITPTPAHRVIESGHPADSSIPTNLELIHFEGTLEDMQQGRIVFKKKYCVICSNEVLLPPQGIPHWDDNLSILHSPFSERMSSVFGTSPLMESVDLHHTRNDLMNQFNNYMSRLLDPPTLIDTACLAQDDPLNGVANSGMAKIRPGQKVEISVPPNVKTDPVRVMQLGELPQSAWQYLPMFNATLSEVTGVDSDLMGTPRSRGRMSALETQSRSANGSNLVVELFESLDQNLIGKVLEVMLLRTFQYLDQDAWENFILTNKSDILPNSDMSPPDVKSQWDKKINEMAKWDSVERYTNLAGMFKFSVNLFSSQLERQMKMEQISYFLKFLSELPQMQSSVNFPELLREIAQVLGLDVESILNKAILPPPSPLDGTQQPGVSSNTPQEGVIPPGISGSVSGGPREAVPNMPTPPPGLQ